LLDVASQPLSSQSSKEFVTSSHKSDYIKEFTEDKCSFSSSQTISDFSQTQSILHGAKNVEGTNNNQNSSVIGGVIPDVVEVIQTGSAIDGVMADIVEVIHIHLIFALRPMWTRWILL